MPSTDASVVLKDSLCSSHLEKTVSSLSLSLFSLNATLCLSTTNETRVFFLFHPLINRCENFQSDRKEKSSGMELVITYLEIICALVRILLEFCILMRRLLLYDFVEKLFKPDLTNHCRSIDKL